MVKIHIDNIEYEVKEGKNLLESILSLGMNLPYFCWHPKLGSVGACRQCAVKTFKDADDTKGKIIMSCMEPIKEGMRISLKDKEATTFRSHITESLMTNHPHDCPTCDEGGECHLQDMTIMTGHTYRRFKFNKRTFENQYLGPLVNHEMNRCIACYRCVRFYKDYAGGKDLEVLGSHNLIYFGRHEDGVLESEFSGNLVEVCPTGVFTDKTLKKHFTRKWDYTTAPSVCNLCSLGCNTIAGERYGKIRRIRTRYNKEVNGYFLCDRGRYGYEHTNSSKRILVPALKDTQSETGYKDAGIEEVQSAFNKIFKESTDVMGIGSERASLESNYALKTLVGADNFYLGMSDVDYELNHLAAEILRNSSAEKYSLKEIENTECVLILGEDLTNTAPMMALAVRQSVRQKPMHRLDEMKINRWDDKTVRDTVQQEKGPLFNITPTATKIDELGLINLHTDPDNIAEFGFAVAHFMDDANAIPENISKEHSQMAKSIAETLMEAENSVIISGTSCLNANILKAAYNISEARAKQGKKTGISLTFREANSLGLTLLGGKKLSEIDKSAQHETLVILENDLYRKAPSKEIDELLKSFKNTIAIDSLMNSTTSKADYLLPAGTIYESDGHLVNNEGRVQRFYKVFVKEEGEVRSAQEWVQMLSENVDVNPLAGLKNIFDYGEAIEKDYAVFKGLAANITPLAFREGAQKVAREPHRYSGRTATHANETVHEPTPPKDHESPMSFSMEGFHGTPAAPLTPFFWSPGWNSVQAINKYQIEIGGDLRREISQLCIFKNTATGNVRGEYYKMEVDDNEHQKDKPKGKWKVLPLYHIFGSDELSVVEGGIKELAPLLYIGINPESAKKMGWDESTEVRPAKGDNTTGIQLRFSDEIPEDCVGIPIGLEQMPFVELEEWQNLSV
ncbi:MAG: NADH-quinone oxidoreductase subunit NuoG [Mariniphaga sp.]|jgi:NADH-quinone oxidoreductase subunit G|nr:NADH-quinone oxidoreductase subunit NuoG [Mariniphaga sp.]